MNQTNMHKTEYTARDSSAVSPTSTKINTILHFSLSFFSSLLSSLLLLLLLRLLILVFGEEEKKKKKYHLRARHLRNMHHIFMIHH